MRHHRHSCNHKRFLLIIFYICSLSSISLSASGKDIADAQESHPGLANESRYAEAVIAYNKKKTAEALKILDELLKGSPKNIEYLEMKALVLKGKGDEKASFELYKQLYEAKPEKERGPYAFEMATLLQKQKRNDEAKEYFQKSADLGFNIAASHLYIALDAFNATKYAEAENHFGQALGSGIPEIELVSQYYISLCYFKLNFSTRGIQELLEAKEVALKILKTNPKNENAKNIADGADKMLEPFSKGQFFGTAALTTQYDSNIQQLPAGSSNTNSSSGASTVKENMLASIGYMSAPSNDFQVVASYRASYNKNFNSLTKAYEYFTNNASVYLNYRALAKTTYSAKIDGAFAFQNSLITPSNANGGYEFQKYNSTFGGGLAVRHQIDRYWRGEAELNMRTQKFFADSTQNGTNFNMALTARRTGGDNFFNPSVSALFESNNANGNLSYYMAYGGGVANNMNLAGQLTLTQGIDFLYTNYSRSSPLRKDTNITFRLGALKQLSTKFTLMLDGSYIMNNSTVAAAYTYNRFLTGLGVGFAL